MCNGYVLMDDFNGRFGSNARKLPVRLNRNDMSYPEIADPVKVPNDNSNDLIGILCTDEHVLVLNNLKTCDSHFKSNLTYRQEQTWISEKDSCPASLNLVSCISNFLVHLNLALPSDHAPLSISIRDPSINLEHLAAQAAQLEDHAVLHFCH